MCIRDRRRLAPLHRVIAAFLGWAAAVDDFVALRAQVFNEHLAVVVAGMVAADGNFHKYALPFRERTICTPIIAHFPVREKGYFCRISCSFKNVLQEMNYGQNLDFNVKFRINRRFSPKSGKKEP